MFYYVSFELGFFKKLSNIEKKNKDLFIVYLNLLYILLMHLMERAFIIRNNRILSDINHFPILRYNMRKIKSIIRRYSIFQSKDHENNEMIEIFLNSTVQGSSVSIHSLINNDVKYGKLFRNGRLVNKFYLKDLKLLVQNVINIEVIDPQLLSRIDDPKSGFEDGLKNLLDEFCKMNTKKNRRLVLFVQCSNAYGPRKDKEGNEIKLEKREIFKRFERLKIFLQGYNEHKPFDEIIIRPFHKVTHQRYWRFGSDGYAFTFNVDYGLSLLKNNKTGGKNIWIGYVSPDIGKKLFEESLFDPVIKDYQDKGIRETYI